MIVLTESSGTVLYLFFHFKEHFLTFFKVPKMFFISIVHVLEHFKNINKFVQEHTASEQFRSSSSKTVL